MPTIFNLTNCCNNMFYGFEWPYKNLQHVAATNCCVKNCPRAMLRKKSPRVTSDLNGNWLALCKSSCCASARLRGFLLPHNSASKDETAND